MIQNIELIYGDCLDKMKDIPDCSIDFVLTDLPYGTTKCKWDIIIPFEAMWASLKRIIKSNTAIALFGGQPFTSKLIMSNLKMYRYDWLWKKNKAGNWMFGNKMPLKIFENISIFYSHQPKYNPQKIMNPKGISKRHLYENKQKIGRNVKEIVGENWKETKMDSTDNYHGCNYEPDKLLPTTELYFKPDRHLRIHPTQKPVDLLEYLIKTYTNESEVVLDFTSGSFSTAIACLNTNRNFIGIEKDDKIFQAGEFRVKNYILGLDSESLVKYTVH